jgi:hypothetical protein
MANGAAPDGAARDFPMQPVVKTVMQAKVFWVAESWRGVRLSILLGAIVVCTFACRHASSTAPPAVSGGAGPATRNTATDAMLLETRCVHIDQVRRCVLWGPSLAELIARPELYDGKRVRVIGFVNFEFEGNGLYMSREDWEQSIFRNGVWIDPPARFQADGGPAAVVPNQRYVIVEGTFDARHTGHMGMWSGAVERVTRLDPWGRQPSPTLVPGGRR